MRLVSIGVVLVSLLGAGGCSRPMTQGSVKVEVTEGNDELFKLSADELSTFKATVAELFTSPQVLERVSTSPRLESLKSIRREDLTSAWLAQKIATKWESPDVLHVTLTASPATDPGDVVHVMNALCSEVFAALQPPAQKELKDKELELSIKLQMAKDKLATAGTDREERQAQVQAAQKACEDLKREELKLGRIGYWGLLEPPSVFVRK